MTLTAADLSEMGIAFVSLFGGFLKKIAPPDVPEVWTSYASAVAACAFIAVKLIVAESSNPTVMRWLFPAAFMTLALFVVSGALHMLARGSRIVPYDEQQRIAGTEYTAVAKQYIADHPGRSQEDILLASAGDAGRVWTEPSLRRSRRLLGVGYALCVALLAFGIELSVEAYNLPKEAPKFTDICSNLADVHFDLDKTDLGQDAMDKIKANATILLSVLKQFPHAFFLLDGFCDDQGSTEHNFALGYKRAEVTRDALIHAGVPRAKLQVASHGKNSLLCNETSEQCRQKNRRVHVTAVE
jgi:outer membrane protein OmpA-like peptidoglycan-associated protein